PGQVDAAMAGRIYISGMAPRPSLAKKQRFRHRNRKGYRSQRGHSRGRNQNSRRPSRATWLSLFSSEESNLGANNYDDYRMDWLVPATCEPIQSVFFFSGDKYYRVNLRTRRWQRVGFPPEKADHLQQRAATGAGEGVCSMALPQHQHP
ncbi:hypothetical protein KI723_170617, partial [Homo sapiens]